MDRPIRWKNGARCAVMISFDVDGESPWILRDPALAERPLHMGMGAYGPKTGMPRIMRVLERYDLKCGFFIPGWIVERYPDMAPRGRCGKGTRSATTATCTRSPSFSRAARRRRRCS